MNGVLSIEELRVRGFSTDDFSDGELLELESRVWETIMLFTERVFENRNLTLKIDGSGISELALPEAIDTISSVEVADVGALTVGTDYIVYNRRVPDDRNRPKLLALDGVWPIGSQNITITGTFGYTDPNSPVSHPPKPLIEVAMRLMPIFAEHLLEGAEREVDVSIHKRDVQREATDRWSYTRFGRQAIEQTLLDDPFINAILLQYRKGSSVICGDWV